MKRFRFRLQRLLRLRQQTEDQCRQQLRATMERLRQAEWEVEKAILNREMARARSHELILELPSTLHQVVAMEEHIETLESQVTLKQRWHGLVMEELQEAQDRYRAARADRGSLEQIRGRRLLEHNQALEAEEQKVLEELARIGFLEQTRGASEEEERGLPVDGTDRDFPSSTSIDDSRVMP